MIRVLHIFTLAVLLCTFTKSAAQKNTYLGLWGKILQDRESKNTTVESSSLTADTNNNNLQSRILQRLQGAFKVGDNSTPSISKHHNVTLWNASESFAELSSILEKLDALSSSPPAPLKVSLASHTITSQNGSSSSLAKASTLNNINIPVLNNLDLSSITNIFDQIQERVTQALPENVDVAQLAAIAIIQGLLLRALANGNAPSLPLAGPLGNGLGNRLGRSLPNSMGEMFEPQLCMRLQNFANADGYHVACLGGCPCMTTGSETLNTGSSTGLLSWGTDASFSLQCDGPKDVKLGSNIPILGNLVPNQDPSTCILVVASGNGKGSIHTGTILDYPRPSQPYRGIRLSHLRVKLCNIPPSPIQFPARLQGSGSKITLHNFRLNGKELAGFSDALVASHASAPDNCEITFLRIPARALASGFVLSGSLDIVGSGKGPWGIGEMASLDVQFG